MLRYPLSKWFVLGALCLSIVSCGGGGTNDISGLITGSSFTIAAGETRRVTGDLTVTTTGPISIAGTLNIEPGVNVALIAAGPLTVEGTIQGLDSVQNPQTRISRDGGSSGTITFEGDSITLKGTVKAGKGVHVRLAGHNEEVAITINGYVNAGDGVDSTQQGVNGSNGGSIQIGSADAIKAAKDKGGNGFKPKTVTVTGSLRSGRGGDGYVDFPGVVGAGNVRTFSSTAGGNGGDIVIIATDSITGRPVFESATGRGGDGGKCGTNADGDTLTHATDGQANQPGQSVSVTTGKGGNGGSWTLTSAATGYENRKAGRRGIGGSSFASAGNGGVNADGGDLTVHIGDDGSDGTGAPVQDTAIPAVFAEHGGNGGESIASDKPGGNGGKVTVVRSGNIQLEGQDYGVGGIGYDNCIEFPYGPGTKGGTAFKPTAGTKTFEDAHADTFRGGGGGNGNQPGQGGLGPNGNGSAGRACNATELAVILDYDLADTTGVAFKKGRAILLRHVTNGHVALPEAATETHGCLYHHLHEQNKGQGIKVKIGMAPERGPFLDKDQPHCGFGRVISVLKQP